MKWNTLAQAKTGNVVAESVLVARVERNEHDEILTRMGLDTFYGDRVAVLQKEEAESKGNLAIRWLRLPSLEVSFDAVV